MRIAWVFMLTAWLAGYAPGYVVAAAPPGSESGTLPTGAPLFHDGAFVFVPTPTLEPDNPLFYRGSFRAPARPEATFDPLTATALLLVPAPTPMPSTIAPSAIPALAPTPMSPIVAPSAISTSAPTAPGQTVTVPYAAGPAPTVTPTPLVLGAEPDPRFHTDSFYLPPLIPNPVDEPDHYRGSVTADPGGVLAAPAANMAVLPVIPYADLAPKGSVVDTTFETLHPSYAEPSPLPVQGRAMYYNAGIMSAVYAYRLQNKEVDPCPECVGYVALLRAGDLNRKVWLRWEDGTIEGPFLVIDVAARQHVALLLSRNWVVDVDFQTALRHNMNGPLAVTVLASPPFGVADAPDFRMEIPYR